MQSVALAIRPKMGDVTIEPDPSCAGVRFVFHQYETSATLPLERAMEGPPGAVWADAACLLLHVTGHFPAPIKEHMDALVWSVRQAAIGCAMGPSPGLDHLARTMVEQLDREMMADVTFPEHTQKELEDGVMKADIRLPLSSDQKQDLQGQIGRLREKEK